MVFILFLSNLIYRIIDPLLKDIPFLPVCQAFLQEYRNRYSNGASGPVHYCVRNEDIYSCL